MRVSLLCAAAAAVLISGEALANAMGGGGSSGPPSTSAPRYDPAADYTAGLAALKVQKWVEAERSLARVTKAAPKVADAWFALGLARDGKGDLKGAKGAYERTVKLAPDNVLAQGKLGAVMARMQDTASANAVLAKLKQQEAACGGCASAGALKTSIADIEAAQGTATPAPAADTRLLFGDPASGDRAYLSAVGLINERRYDEALRALDAASRSFGPHPDVLTLIGYTRRKLGELDWAEAYYRQALAIAPDHRGATEYYGELKVERGDLAGARKMLASLEAQCAYGCPEAEELRRWIEAGREPL